MAPISQAKAAEARTADDTASGLAIIVGPGPVTEPNAANTPGVGDVPGSLQRVEDAIANLDCSRLQLVPLPRTGEFELRGHVPTAEMASDLVAASRRLAGGNVSVTGNLMVLPPPVCAVLDTVRATGLPQSDDQQNDPLTVGRQAWAQMPRAIDGQVATFGLQAPDYDSYVYVDYFDSDGNVQHLTPSELGGENRFNANATFDIGRGEDSARLFFAPPLGLDIVLVIAATEPLYGGIRPFAEDGRNYLTWLQSRIRTLREERPDVRGEWVFMLMLTESG